MRLTAGGLQVRVGLAWIALGGLVVNAIFKVSWADPIAALLPLPIILREVLEATGGKSCDCSE